MPRQPPVSVTFDTNTLSGVVDPDRHSGAADHAAYRAIHAAVREGHVRGFFSETIVTLDAIGRKDKAKVLGAARFVSETTSAGPHQFTIRMGPRWKHVDIDQRILARIEVALDMGMRALIGPRRFGDTRLVLGFGECFYEYPSGAALAAMADTVNAVDAAIVARGLGRWQVIDLAKLLSERDGAAGEWWPQALERTRTKGDSKRVSMAVSEWADGEAVAAHVGYGNDLFCTHDLGGALREKSILHPIHRAWLSERHSVTFASVIELAERLTTV